MIDENAWPPKFTLSQEKILQLLTGDRFYSNASAALREVILNALDAVHRRKADEPDHVGAIWVTFDPSPPTLTCEDNGDGMSQEAVVHLFATVGASASNLDARGQGTVGEFGIGVISYFMASDEFEIETCDGEHDPVGLRFQKEMFHPDQPAELITPVRTTRGTTLRLKLRDAETYRLLRDQYPHWCRHVVGLTATEEPNDTLVLQGEQVSPGNPDSPPVTVLIPEGIEDAFLRPIATADAWEIMSGASTITILYRGVFVQDYVANALWGMTGSIFVDPKHFKPRLNREGFVGTEFQAEIDAFLRSSHPAVLSSLVDVLSQAVERGILNTWTTQRWATLWLSIPRDSEYNETAEKWDGVFRRIPAFELSKHGEWTPATVNDIVGIPGPIYVAPYNLQRENDVVQSAVRLLRQMEKPVIRGLERDRGWLTGAGNYFTTTADLISNQFRNELPELQFIAPTAEDILQSLDSLHILYGGDRPVELVALGEGSPPVLRVRHRLLINTDTDSGRSLIQRTLELNRGRRGLVEAALEKAPTYLQQVVDFAGTDSTDGKDILGLVKRRYIRSVLP